MYGGKRGEIYKLMIEFLTEKGCAQYSEIVRFVKSKLNVNEKTIHGSLHVIRKDIDTGKIKDIEHPERGLFCLKDKNVSDKSKTLTLHKQLKEEDFYDSLADYLVYDLEECTKAIPLGGNVFKDKWGTPDVLGVYKFPEYVPIKPPPQIVSCELKIDRNQLIVAFGQACSYKIFSHKVYLVIPKDSSKDEIRKMESLCSIFGLGLILFNSYDSKNPDYEIRTRALNGEPDYYYLNKYINQLPDEKKKKLFS